MEVLIDLIQSSANVLLAREDIVATANPLPPKAVSQVTLCDPLRIYSLLRILEVNTRDFRIMVEASRYERNVAFKRLKGLGTFAVENVRNYLDVTFLGRE